MKLKRALLRGMAVCLALTAVTATVEQQAIAAPGPSVNAPDVRSVPVTNGSLASRGPDEATSRALSGNQPAASSTPGGGSFAATPFSASASWEVSKQSGDFSWAYPLRVPPAPGGFAPSLGLSYRSSAVDGLTAVTNNQPSWVGEGWDLSAGFIERAYGACAQDDTGGTTPPKTGDLCWRSDNATASYGGRGGVLIKDDATGTWHGKSDDRSRIERLTVAGNGDNDGESWKITTADGTQYLFGSRPEAKSTWTVPVFGDDDGEPCHQTTFDGSSCDQAWRWMLDKVVDPRGNVILYSYETETNNYGKNLKEAAATYVRAGTLKLIEYGLHTTVPGQAAGRVEFGLTDRCVKESSCTFDKKENWPDSPISARCDTGTCKDNYSPTFWSTKKLSTITTRVLRGTGYTDVDRWTLRHEFPKGDDVYQAALWLKGITHTGLVGGEAALPEVTFEGTAMPNRVDTPTGIGPLNRYRITGVVSEAGGVTTVKYAAPDCVPGGTMPANAESNSLRCYPVKWAPDLGAERDDYFHKYVVESITTSDRYAGSAEQIVKYEYLDGAAWRYDRSEFTKDDKKSWNEFRGYGRVRIRTGHENDAGGPVTMTEERFYRGMHGDKLPNNGVRSVKVKDSEGGEREDSDWLHGFSFESQNHSGTGEDVVTKTISTPSWAGPTSTRGDYKAYWTGTASTSSYTKLRAGGWRVTKSESEYDDHGQVVANNDLGDVGTAADDRCTRTVYAQNPAKWMWSYPSESETVAVSCTTAAVFPAQALGGSRTTYDDSANVTKVEVIDQRPASSPIWAVASTTTYDAYGRPLAVTDALNNTSRTEYIPATGGPLTGTVVTDPLGHAVTSTVEPAWGLASKIVDANENTTEAAFDPLGRTMHLWKPNRPRQDFSDRPSMSLVYDVQRDAPSSITSTTLAPNGNYLKSTVVYDGLYRPRQNQYPTYGGRLIVDTRYDSQGRVVRATQEFFNANPVDKNLLSFSETDVPGLTRTEYDDAGRAKNTIFQAGGQEKWRSTTAYGGDRVDTTPPSGGTPTTVVNNARGEMTELHQYKGAAASGDHDTTRYSYTSSGKLASVTDQVGNTWRWSYDLRGRLTKTEDVDKGTSTYTYDALNRVESVTDARNTTLTNTYDALGRKKSVKSGTTVLQEFAYDTAQYGKGLLATSTHYSGGQAYVNRIKAYSSLDKPLSVETQIPDSEGPLKGLYKASFTYKADGSRGSIGYGSITAAGMPSETVLTEYDDFGRPLKTSAGLSGSGTDTLVNTTAYTRLGELYRLELGTTGKRMWLSNYYDDNTRRMNRYIVDAEVASPMQADVNYAYDAVGNINSITDAVQGKAVDRQCFKYDYLRRLTEAWTPGGDCAGAPSTASLSGPAPYWQSFGYDQTGNRLTETRHAASGDTTRTYGYPASGSPRAHAVNSVTTTGPGLNQVDEFTYNAIGATATRKVKGNNQTFDWDAEGRVTKVTEGTKVTEFVYGADGSRLIRRDTNGTTLYLGDQELRLDKGATTPTVTRYYAHGGKAVAMREGKTKLTWLASDIQGTNQIAVNRSTMDVQQRRQLPFGELRGTATDFPGERGFVGGTDDDSTGLVHIGARQYDAALGKFTSVDPIMDHADPQQWNAYAYANNSPITFSDPTGLAYCDYNVCAGDSGYNPNGPRNNVSGQCVHNCHLSHNNYSSGSDAPGGVALQSVKDYGSGFVADYTEGAAYLNGVKLPWTPAEADVHIPRAMKTFGGPIYGELGSEDNVENTFNTLIAYCKRSCSIEDYNEISLPWLLFLGETGALSGNGRGGNAPLARSVQRFVKRVCGRNSFTGDTLVLMADGTTKRIDEIEVGSDVANSEPASEQVEQHEVVAVIVTDEDKEYVDLTVSTPRGPEVIRTTAHHPFFDAGADRWVPAVELESGDLLQTPGNGRAALVAVRHYSASQRTYNLTVDSVHTFFVAVGATAVLVHNCNANGLKRGVFGQSKADLEERINFVVDFFDMNNRPPAHTMQGQAPGRPVGEFQNNRNRLPVKPLGYYTETDIWPLGTLQGGRGAERLVLGKNNEVYYTGDHYKTFIRLR
jgi:RHS repeat-associated protein